MEARAAVFGKCYHSGQEIDESHGYEGELKQVVSHLQHIEKRLHGTVLGTAWKLYRDVPFQPFLIIN